MRPRDLLSRLALLRSYGCEASPESLSLDPSTLETSESRQTDHLSLRVEVGPLLCLRATQSVALTWGKYRRVCSIILSYASRRRLVRTGTHSAGKSNHERTEIVLEKMSRAFGRQCGSRDACICYSYRLICV